MYYFNKTTPKVTGRPKIFSIIDGTLPNTLQFNGLTGEISGTPLEDKKPSTTIKVRACRESNCLEATFTVNIKCTIGYY